jgi:hypothetical protein
MNIKLSGFEQVFEREIEKNLVKHNVFLTKHDDFAFEVIVDPDIKHIKDRSKTILALVEPQVVRPDLYLSKTLKSFAAVFPLSYYRAQRLNLEEWFDFPVHLPTYIKDNRPRTENFAIVNEHKFSASMRSQYGLRRDVIKYFEQNEENQLSLYGVEWERGKLIELRRRIFAIRQSINSPEFSPCEALTDLWHSYKFLSGHMHGDCEELQKFKFSIVIENDTDYVSEKIWKSLYAGVVPVYIGPDLSKDAELKNLIGVTEPNLAAVVGRINEVKNLDLPTLRKKIESFLNNIESTKYGLKQTSTHFANSLLSLINRK